MRFEPQPLPALGARVFKAGLYLSVAILKLGSAVRSCPSSLVPGPPAEDLTLPSSWAVPGLSPWGFLPAWPGPQRRLRAEPRGSPNTPQCCLQAALSAGVSWPPASPSGSRPASPFRCLAALQQIVVTAGQPPGRSLPSPLLPDTVITSTACCPHARHYLKCFSRHLCHKHVGRHCHL